MTQSRQPEIVRQIAADIYQVMIPAPFRRLGAVNCYLLAGNEGWTIVDTGLNTPDAQAAWRLALEIVVGETSKVTQIIVTHAHPDHLGLAGWLQQWVRWAGTPVVPVRMSAAEIKQATEVWGQRLGYYQHYHSFWVRCGVPVSLQAQFDEGFEQIRRATWPHPDGFETLEPGMILPIGQRRFQVLHTPGHSNGHLAFYDLADRLIIIGDQVLFHITPNIGFWPGTEPDPLARYLNSLDELAGLEVRLALPGHGPIITNWSERIGEIKAHHAERLAQTLSAVGAGVIVYDISRQLFNFDTLSPHEMQFALVETLAHLEYLVNQGQLQDYESGVWWYQPA
jgi:glyoxylase-like metal-dependent hydrolase (beta-lactamase superfamily II)